MLNIKSLQKVHNQRKQIKLKTYDEIKNICFNKIIFSFMDHKQ